MVAADVVTVAITSGITTWFTSTELSGTRSTVSIEQTIEQI